MSIFFRVILLTFFLGLLHVGFLSGQSGYGIEQVIFLPPQHYVGDVVEARIKLQVEGENEVSVPDSYPSRDHVLIHSIEVDERDEGCVIRIKFSSFAVGNRTLPRLQLGDINLTGIEYTTTSLLEAEQIQFQEIREQLLLPGTYLLFGAIFSGIVLIFLILFPGIRIFRQWLQRWSMQRQHTIQFNRVMKTAKTLRNKAESMSGQQFYTLLCDTLKVYLHYRLQTDFLSKTTEELRGVIHEQFGDKESEYPVWKVLEYGDRVKFGRLEPPAECRLRDIEIMDNTARWLEQSEREYVGS